MVGCSSARMGLIFLVFLAVQSIPGLSAELGQYPVSTGDELSLDFLDDGRDPHLLKVGAAGEVHLPYIGALQIGGLTVEEARQTIEEAYVSSEIFLKPRVELSFVAMRQLSVLGDVRSPGFHDFRPFITVEQAVGLAGGPASLVRSEEDRSLQRASLRGQIASQDIALAREVIAAQRLRAQLAGADSIDVSGASVPAMTIVSVAPAMVERLVAEEHTIMMAEREDHALQLAHLDRAIEEHRTEIGFMDEQIVLQTDRIASYDVDLSVSRDLRAIARMERQAAEDEYALLSLRAARIRTLRGLAGLERERESLHFRREQAWRVDLNTRQTTIAQLMAQRVAQRNQLQLLVSLSARMAEAGEEMSVDFVVRRRVGDAFETFSAAPTDELWPGDTVIVQVSLPKPNIDFPSN
jgi:protein involved in polysaccharide export with SLBB domain